jgi:hypothetical protein
MTATTAPAVQTIRYETATCTRCGGSGQMPFAAYGGRCFKCNGNGETMTAAGRRARAKVEAYAAEHLMVPASAVRPGDKIVGNDGKTRTVVEVETTLGQGNGRSKVGVEGTESFVETWTYGSTTIHTGRNSYGGAAHRAVRVAWTQDHLAAAAQLVAHLKGAIVTYKEEA